MSAKRQKSFIVLLLAAGVGRRLEQGEPRPKVLLDFAGKSLLARHLEALASVGARELIIVTGFMAEAIEDAAAALAPSMQVGFVHNPRFREGSVVSLAAGAAMLRRGETALLMDGDVLYDARMLERLLDGDGENALLVDRELDPGDEPVKVCFDADGRIVDFRKRPEHAGVRHGESVGFFRFSATMGAALADRAAWYADNELGGAEYEEAIRDLILAAPERFAAADVTDLPWTEIDFPEDVVRARDHILPLVGDVRLSLIEPIVAEAWPAASELSETRLAAYARQGWVSAQGFFSPTETADILRWTEQVCALPETPGEHMVYHEPSLLDPNARVIQRIENFCPYHAAFDALVRGGRLQRAVEQLLGARAVLFKEKINFKMPGGAGFEPHQDQQAGWSVFAPLFVTALVCIDSATLENGCLEMADAPRVAGLIGQEWTPLTVEEMAGFALIPVPTEPGDVLFFDSYAPHASQPNLTAAPRRILYLTYNEAAAGDHRAQYFADKRQSFPPDVERTPGVDYKFRV